MKKCSLKSTQSKWPCFLQNYNCQKKNENWACIHELKCLLAYKDIETNDSQDKKTLLKNGLTP